MNEHYLWDRSGEPDPEIQRLENLLSPFRYKDPVASRKSVVRRRQWWAAAAAAVLVLGFWQLFRVTRTPSEKTSWQAVTMTGSPRVNGRPVSGPAYIYTGQRIETDAASRLQVRSEFVGQVELDPNSEIYVKESSENRQLLSLRHGTLHALIWAPPSQFAVDTPSARAVDLGCAYTLKTQSDGNGLITVQRGWVAFDHKGSESFIPADAACRVYARRGPGVPWFEDAAPELRNGLEQWENRFAAESLDVVLAAARPRDALTLWHLLSRVPDAQRGVVFDRFASMVKLPAGVRREAVIAQDTRALDLCWDSLDLGDTSWWRTWKRAW
jgi:ferric-dicitrate binding protein FerR (iron transport regulator)